MSGGTFCDNPAEHKQDWRVHMREHNRSAFNGYRATPSDYSGVVCLAPGCRGSWRSKGVYVDTLPDINEQERLTWRAEPRDAQSR